MACPIRVAGVPLTRILMACVLLAGGAGASVLLAAGSAEAGVCGSAVVAGTPCTDTGTLTLTVGSLNMTSPSSLTWSGTVSGVDQNLVDGVPGDQSYLVDDATGNGAGWHVTISATTFTTAGSVTMADAGTFSTTGSITSSSAITAPTAACAAAATCTLPTNGTTYPVAITTASSAPTPATIYDTAAATGLGSITVGVGAHPVGWWLNVRGSVLAGTYTSTITYEVLSGP
jgi:putative surface cell wall-binding protein